MDNWIDIVESSVVESPVDPEGKSWQVTIIEGGFNKSRQRYYTTEALSSIATLASTNRLQCFANHMTEAEAKAQPAGDVREVIGWYTDVAFNESANRVEGKLNMLVGESSPYPHLPKAMLEAYERGNPNLFDLSIRGSADSKVGFQEGHKTTIIRDVKVLASTDLVTRGGAGGAIQTVLESAEQRSEKMNEEMIAAMKNMSADELKEAMSKADHGALLQAPAEQESDEDKAKREAAEAEAAKAKAEGTPAQESIQEGAEGLTAVSEEAVAEQVQAGIAQGIQEFQSKYEAVTSMNEKVRNSGLPVPLQEDLLTKVGDGSINADAQLEEALTKANALVTSLTPAFVSGPVILDPNQHSQNTQEGWDKYRKAMVGLINGEDYEEVSRFRTLKEAYSYYRNMVGRPINPYRGNALVFDLVSETQAHTFDPIMHQDPERQAMIEGKQQVQEAVLAGYGASPHNVPTFTDLLGTSMYRVFLDQYARLRDKYMDYMKILSHPNMEIPNFQRHDWIRRGLYPTIPVVNENTAYSALTTPGEERVSMQLIKYGGTEQLTMEAISNDSLNALQGIPRDLATSVHIDRYRQVFDIFTTGSGLGPTMPYNAPGQTSANTLFHANHSNLSTTATFGPDNLQASRLEFMKQVAKDGGGRALLHMDARFVLVPLNLYTQAEQLYIQDYQFGAGQGTTTTGGVGVGAGGVTMNTNPLKGRLEPIKVPYWTDTNNFYLVADPGEFPTVAMGYFPGHREPMLLTQDNPLVGDVFTKDAITFKVRDIRDVIVLDHRSFRGHVITG